MESVIRDGLNVEQLRERKNREHQIEIVSKTDQNGTAEALQIMLLFLSWQDKEGKQPRGKSICTREVDVREILVARGLDLG